MRDSIKSIGLAAAMSWVLASLVTGQAGLAYENTAFEMLQAETAMNDSNIPAPATPRKKKQAKPDGKLHGGVMKKGDEVQSQDNTATATSSQEPIQLDANTAGAQLPLYEKNARLLGPSGEGTIEYPATGSLASKIGGLPSASPK
jgi:hypothetical protein